LNAAYVAQLHEDYLAAGADIIETNTFSSTAIAQADYALEPIAYELNLAGARLAREAADEWTARTPDRPRFVAGAIGPTNRTLSISPDIGNPAFRAVTFDQVSEAYRDQVRGLLDGGVDLLLIETIFDTLNAKAAGFAVEQVYDEMGVELPIMLSDTITDLSGRNLSGQTPEAFWYSLKHLRPFSVGLNCSFGAEQLRPSVDEISHVAEVLTHPCDAPRRQAERILEIAADGEAAGLAKVAVGVDGRLAGVVVMADRLRDDARALADRLRATGVRRVAMVTGDRAPVAERIAADTGLDRVFAEQSPEQKLAVVRSMRADPELAPVVMVGDGVNDAPALALADVGIAMAGPGATISSETADAVIVVDRIDRVATAVAIGRRALGIARQSVVFGIALSAAAMVVAAFGYLPPLAGALLQEGIDVAVILNALRALTD